MNVSVDDEVRDPRDVRPHLVLLGAGASRAALPSGDASGRRLPVMADFFEHVPITPILDRAGVAWRGANFEDVYSSLSSEPSQENLCLELEEQIEQYFGSLRLPPEPTIYDYLLLSLRSKDVVATFNWDPFLIQAYRRSAGVTKNLPHFIFLHGNVLHGYCERDKISGVRGAVCSRCGVPFPKDQLLFPVAKKDYSTHPSIAIAWNQIRAALKDALCFTIFGYGAPQSDRDALDLLSSAWGSASQRQFEEIELIDVRPEQQLLQSWKRFIHTHHYEVHAQYWDSFLANHPRRSVEAFHNTFIEAHRIKNNPAPENVDLATLHSWFAYLVEAERRAGV